MQLIKDWKKAYRFLSVQMMAVGTAISSTYAALYDNLKDVFDPKIMAGITAAVFIMGIIGRVKSQGIEDD